MQDLIAESERMIERARAVAADAGVVEAWESVGARVELVGSLRTGLMMRNRDIDFHIYTEPLTTDASFAAMAALARNPRIKRVEYANLLDTDEDCLEWHARYEDPHGDAWQIDMIHIRAGSAYAGYFETVAERIRAALTPETRLAVLRIKDAMPPERKVTSAAVYQAVLRDGVRDWPGFVRWLEEHPVDGIIDWMPEARAAHIRPAEPEDRAALAELHAASIRRLCAGSYALEQVASWAGLIRPEIYDEALEHKILLTACADGRPCALGILDPAGAEVDALYVAPEHAGRGAGSALLREMEKRAAREGLAELTVQATLNARDFYARRGYAFVADAEHVLPDGTRLACVRMRKALPPAV